MIARSFIHLPRIGSTTEQRLWRAGVRDWHALLAQPEPAAGTSRARWDEWQGEARASLAALQALDHAYFSSRLPPREHWRAFDRFRRRAAYVDIETTGMGGWAEITVVGVYDGIHTRTYVRGDNLDELADDLSRYSLLITYNGASFDLPFLRRRFRHVRWDHLHLDLRYPLHRLGYRGGLKAIEPAFGLVRAPDIAHLDGFDAVRLWHEYKRGSEEALALLIRYNTADIRNLEVLAEQVYERLSEELVRQARAGMP